MPLPFKSLCQTFSYHGKSWHREKLAPISSCSRGNMTWVVFHLREEIRQCHLWERPCSAYFYGLLFSSPYLSGSVHSHSSWGEFSLTFLWENYLLGPPLYPSTSQIFVARQGTQAMWLLSWWSTVAGLELVKHCSRSGVLKKGHNGWDISHLLSAIFIERLRMSNLCVLKCSD